MFALQVVKSIEADYKQQRTKAISHVKSIIQNRNFSVLFHKLGNSSTVEISVNYWMDDCDRISPLDNRIFCITKNCANTILSFEECLENCSAFVVDFDLESELSGMEGIEYQSKRFEQNNFFVFRYFYFNSVDHGNSNYTNIFVCDEIGL